MTLFILLLTATFVVSATGSFLPIQLIYQGKSKRCLPKFTFPSNFHVTFTPNHWSNLEMCENLFKVIIFPYFPATKKELGYPEHHRSLIIMDTFKSQDKEEMKRLWAKNNCELVILPHNITNKFRQALWINRGNSRIFNSFFAFFHENITLIDLLNQLTFLFFAKYTSHCPFFDYRYGSKGSNDVKNKKRHLN